MADFESNLIDRLARIGSQRADRRGAGRLAAAVAAAIAAPAAAAEAKGRGKRKKRGRGGVSDGSNPAGRFCGGIAGIPCPGGFVCVDDPRDDCDPTKGGADCGGVCVQKENPCAHIRCRAGTSCCKRCGGICLPTGVPCRNVKCAPQVCGKSVCPPGEYCCNPSCGVCAPLNGACTQQVCLDPEEAVSD